MAWSRVDRVAADVAATVALAPIGVSLRVVDERTLVADREVAIVDELRAAGLPERWLHRRLADVEVHPGIREAFAVASDIAGAKREDVRGAYIYGGPGTGKTMLEACIARARVESHLLAYPAPWVEEVDVATDAITVVRRPPHTVRFRVVPILLDELRRRGRAAGDGPDPIQDLVDADLLFLDDLGGERGTDWATERLFVVIEGRYGRGLPTIASSNFSPNQLADRGLAPHVSRLLEDAHLVRVTGTDYRVA